LGERRLILQSSTRPLALFQKALPGLELGRSLMVARSRWLDSFLRVLSQSQPLLKLSMFFAYITLLKGEEKKAMLQKKPQI
jgi:hypothetical protein